MWSFLIDLKSLKCCTEFGQTFRTDLFQLNIVVVVVARCRYLQWLVQEQGSEDTLYHTELALSLAKAALDTIPPSLDDIKEDTSSPQGKSLRRDAKGAVSRGASMNHNVLRDMLQTFLAASDKYKAVEVLLLIQESELWKEQVGPSFHFQDYFLLDLVHSQFLLKHKNEFHKTLYSGWILDGFLKIVCSCCSHAGTASDALHRCQLLLFLTLKGIHLNLLEFLFGYVLW